VRMSMLDIKLNNFDKLDSPLILTMLETMAVSCSIIPVTCSEGGPIGNFSER
jgi:hypothetical protein